MDGAAQLLNIGIRQGGRQSRRPVVGPILPPSYSFTKEITRAMDILVRLDQICPMSLRETALKEVARSTARMLIENQMYFSCRKSKVIGRDGAYILNIVEERLKLWSHTLPIRLREEVLYATISTLTGILGIGGIDTFNRTNPLPVLIASAFESLFDSSFHTCTLPSMLQWNKECRLKVLHLLHQAPSRTAINEVREIIFDCYIGCRLVNDITFSEEYLLANCFNRYPKLCILSLPCVCNDDMLARIAQCCTCLEELNVSGSIGVSDEGVQLLSGAPFNWTSTSPQKRNNR